MENIEECEEYERGHGHEGEDAGASMTVAGLRGGRAEGPPELRRDHGRCVVHFDIDSFYAQVGLPYLRQKRAVYVSNSQ